MAPALRELVGTERSDANASVLEFPNFTNHPRGRWTSMTQASAPDEQTLPSASLSYPRSARHPRVLERGNRAKVGVGAIVQVKLRRRPGRHVQRFSVWLRQPQLFLADSRSNTAVDDGLGNRCNRGMHRRWGCAPARDETVARVPVRLLGDYRHPRATEGVTRGSDGLAQAASDACVRTMCERTACPRVPALDRRLLSRQAEQPICRSLQKPSDGLEPSTPSLPWRCSTN